MSGIICGSAHHCKSEKIVFWGNMNYVTDYVPSIIVLGDLDDKVWCMPEASVMGEFSIEDVNAIDRRLLYMCRDESIYV